MPTNRFYSPSRSQYVSQFIPKELPADLMLKGLAAKQQKYDVNEANLIKDGLWDHPALSGRDTEFVKGKKEELEKFVNESLANDDLGSSDFLRKYTKFTSEFKDDDRLSKVKANYDAYQAQEKRWLDLKKKGDNAAADELRYNLDRVYKEYTQDPSLGGQGFEGKYQITGIDSLQEGQDINEELEKYYDQLKDSGADSIKFLQEGLAYKNGWTGVSNKRISEQTSNILDIAYQSDAGKQLQARYDRSQGTSIIELDQMSAEERKEHENNRRKYVADNLLNVGKGFVHGKSTTNLEDAINKQVARKDAEEPFVDWQFSEAGVSYAPITGIDKGTLEGNILGYKKGMWSTIANIQNSVPDAFKNNIPNSAWEAAKKGDFSQLKRIPQNKRGVTDLFLKEQEAKYLAFNENLSLAETKKSQAVKKADGAITKEEKAFLERFGNFDPNNRTSAEAQKAASILGVSVDGASNLPELMEALGSTDGLADATKLYEIHRKRRLAYEEYMVDNSSSTIAVESNWNLPGVEPNKVAAMRKTVNSVFKDPSKWSHYTVQSSNPDFAGKTLKEITETFDLTFEGAGKNSTINSESVTLTNQPVGDGSLAWAIPTTLNGKSHTLYVSTNNITNGGIDQVVNSGDFQANMIYNKGRIEHVDTWEVPKYGGEVVFNYANTEKPITIEGMNYSEREGLKLIGVINEMQNAGYTTRESLDAMHAQSNSYNENQ